MSATHISEATGNAMVRIIQARLERLPKLKSDAIALSNRVALLRLEGEEAALQEALNEYASRVLGHERGGL